MHFSRFSQTHTLLKIYFSPRPLEKIIIHNYALASNKNAPEAKTSHKQALSDSGGLVGSEVGPRAGNIRRMRMIKLT
jgi:hypothetical protein